MSLNVLRGNENQRLQVEMPREVAVPRVEEHRATQAIISDSDRAIDELKALAGRPVSPLKQIAQEIKRLVHDLGEQMGNELETKRKEDDGMTMPIALQRWADDTLRDG